MGHLSIVNQETLFDVIRSGYISVRGNLKEYWLKTLADIISDVLATRKGDFVFPWIIKGKKSENIGFQYIFRVAGDPIYVWGDKYPIKVPLDEIAIKYPKPLKEYKALDLWSCKLLWNAIGKKSLGRGRSLTHQTPMEDKRLIEMLKEVNNNEYEKFEISRDNFKNAIKIDIDLKRKSIDEDLMGNIEKMSPEERISNLDFSAISWRYEKFFCYEKALEAWLMQYMGRESCLEFEKLVLFPRKKIEWFGNYLPFGVAGGNIDVVIIQKEENQVNKKYITVIELKVNNLNRENFKVTADQVSNYSDFLNRAFKSYEYKTEMQKIVLSGISREKDGNETVRWIQYEIIEDGIVCFYG